MTLVAEMELYDRYRLAEAQLAAGQPHEAATTLAPAEDELPVQGLVLLARAYAGSAQLGRARAVLLRVVDADPVDDWARYALGRVEEGLGDRAAAEEHYRVAIALRPRDEYRERLARLPV
ncbi:MAG TPA: tetratricopeptide repeat protein [Mycobacteriales bacterium]|nr:tetratricopeptide repeat protein [Mycobacteriales bacterium]